MFKKITNYIIIFWTVFLCLFTLGLTQIKADTELWSASSIPIVSNATDWLLNENITPLTIGHHYQIRYSVSPGTFLGTYCTGDGIGDTDCIELGTGTHIIESWQVIYTATGGDGVWDFYPDQAYDYVDAYAWCPNTSDCTLTNFSLWEIGGTGPTPTVTEAPTPRPVPTLTPTASPTLSPTPTPASKVFFVPGLGASWNADALINCKKNNYSGDWTLAPYAKEIYEPILKALTTHGWNTFSFYYDWRKDIRSTTSLLTNFVSINTLPGEKVDMIGHSMGGLIGQDYLETQHGGQLAKFLAVGSPFQGSALTYPIWSGGEIWINNLMEKIALTLYLNRCGSLSSGDRKVVQSQIPSIQNLLPTVAYLRNSQTKMLKPVSSMNAKNNYLPTDFVSPFWGVKVGTLSGTGFPTLNVIDVTDLSKNHTIQGNWLDGKPVGKDMTNSGDGTVLSSSSQVVGAINKTINQSHTGLVSSTDGMTEILKFLGYPNSLDDPIYMEPTSALVIIGYPGNFWVTDPTGSVEKDDHGMVSYISPKPGNYDLKIVPQTGNTLFIITQFLPNGQTLYKEYRINGYQVTSKVINLDPKHPTEDVLKDPKHEKESEQHDFWVKICKFFHL